MNTFFFGTSLISCFYGIYLVSTGLLSKRPTFPHKSSFSSKPASVIFQYPDFPTDEEWLPTLHTKNVVVIIDALRHDFVENNDSMLTFVKGLIQEGKAFYSVFLADPPTTTSQRVVGISCGTFPTYLESFLNFSADSLKGSDSFIYQLWNTYKGKCIFYGDNTWTELYSFMKEDGLSEGYISFNMFDLHFVDQAVYHDLNEFYQCKMLADFRFLCLHLLGLDHAGHTFHAKHSAIQGKLAEYNTKIIELMQNITDDVNVFVFGDHGMTEDGDHGGESFEEVATCIINWNAKWTDKNSQMLEVYTEFIAKIESIRRKYSKFQKGISQVDFCSTLCLISGVAIPFENVGSLIPELLLRSLVSKYEDELVIARYVVDAIRLQLYATMNYLKVAEKNATYDCLHKDIQEIDEVLLKSHIKLSAEELRELFLKYYDLSQRTTNQLRNSMVEIDHSRIKHGLLFIAASCLIGILLARSFKTFLFCTLSSFLSIGYISNSHIMQELSTNHFLLNLLLLLTVFVNQTEMRKLNKILTLYLVCLLRFSYNHSQTFSFANVTWHIMFFIGSSILILFKSKSLHSNVLLKWLICVLCSLSEIFFSSYKTFNSSVQKLSLFICIVFLHSSPSILLECIITILQRPIESILLSHILLTYRILHNENYNIQNYKSIYLSLIAWVLFGITGHSYKISEIQWDRAFFAIDGFFPTWNGTLILMNSFGILLLPYCLEESSRFLHSVFAVELIRLFWCSFCVFIHSRHLMAFAIFIPRFLLQVFVVVFVTVAYSVRIFVHSCRK